MQISISELAEYVGRTRATIYSWIQAGHIPPPDLYKRENGVGQPKAVWTKNAERVKSQAKKRAEEPPGRPPKK